MVRGRLVRIPLLLLAAALLCGLPAVTDPVAAQEGASTDATPFVTERGNWRVYALSPDGTMVVAAEPGAPELCTFAVPSGEEIACADLEGADIRLNPADIDWAPDSSGVVFAEMVFVYLQDGDLWFLDAHSGELENLTDDGYSGILRFFDSEDIDETIYADISPAWSPDGSIIAFSRSTIGGGSEDTPSALWLLDVASGEARELALFDPTYPGALIWGMDWSPDSGTVYATAGFAGYRSEDNGVWAFDIETGEGEHLAGPMLPDDPREPPMLAPSVLAVSPTGNALIVSYPAYITWAGITPGRSGYALLDLDSGDITPIEPSGEMSGKYAVTVGPNFAPDGETLIFGVRRPTVREGFVVARNIETGEDTVLAMAPEDVMPVIADPNIPVLISETGVVYVHLAIDSGLLLTLPDEMSAASSGAATSEATSGEAIVIGDRAAVLRSAPDGDAQILMVLQPGTELEPFGEPVKADGRLWLPVREPESGMLGYVRADFVIDNEE
jgi:hypothetical protein